MYKDFFKLEKLPFNLTPDPGYLYLSAKHSEALAGLSYAIRRRKGFVVLTGDAGTGKTTLLSTVINQLPAGQVQSCIILNPILSPAEFLEYVLLDFGVAITSGSKAQRLWKLQEFLLQAYRENRIAILVIDEAHKLAPDVLEEIRLLGNFEYGDDKFLQIILLGQCELDDLLNRQDLRQFKQRVALRIYVDPLPAVEIGDYIRFRWEKAGGTATPFTPEAIWEISLLSRGIPRVINSLCDTALSAAFAEASHIVTELHVTEAGANLGLTKAQLSSAAEQIPISEPAANPGILPQPQEISPPTSTLKQVYKVPSFAGYARDQAGPAANDNALVDDVPTFAGYGKRRKNISLLKLLASKF